MRVRIVFFQRDRLAKALDGLFVAPQRRKNRAAVVMRLGEFRLLLQCGIETRERFFAPLERVQDHAVVHQNLRRRLAQAHHLGDQVQGLAWLAFGELDDAEHLQGIEMVRPMGENLGVDAFRLVQTSLGVQRQRLGESLRHLERFVLLHRCRRHDPPLNEG